MEQLEVDTYGFEFFINSPAQSVEKYFYGISKQFDDVGRADLLPYLRQAKERIYKGRQLYYYGMVDIDTAFNNLTEYELNEVLSNPAFNELSAVGG